MLRLFLGALLFLFWSLPLVAQYNWTFAIGGNDEEWLLKAEHDIDGNIYVLGESSSSSIDFDPSAATVGFTSTSDLKRFIVKYDSGGSFIWKKEFPYKVSDFTLDVNGRLAMTGSFKGTIDVDFSTSQTLLQSDSNTLFIAMYDTACNLQWAQSFESSASDVKAGSIALDAGGDLAITALIYLNFGDTFDLDPSTAHAREAYYPCSGCVDDNNRSIVARYSSSGSYDYHLKNGDTAFTHTGFHPGLVVFNSNADLVWAHVSGAWYPNYEQEKHRIIKITNTGIVTNNISFDDTYFEYDQYVDLEIDQYDNIYLLADYFIQGYNLYPDPSDTNYFLQYGAHAGGVGFHDEPAKSSWVAKYNSSLQHQWSFTTGNKLTFGQYAWCTNFIGKCTDLEVTGNKVLLSGHYTLPMDFDPSNGFYSLDNYEFASLSCNANHDAMVLQFDQSGSFEDAWWLPGPDGQGNVFMGTTPTGRLLVAGEFRDSIDADLDPIAAPSIESNGDYDIFISGSRKIIEPYLAYLTDTTFVCAGYVEPYTGTVINTSQSISDTVYSNSLSMTVIQTYFVVSTSWTTSYSLSLCDGDSALIGGSWVHSAGVYVDSIQIGSGCYQIDSVFVSVDSSSADTISAYACDVYIGPSGNAYFASGVYADVISNNAGCDSNVVIDLEIEPDYAYIQLFGCDSIDLPNGIKALTSGFIHDTITTDSGCIQVVDLEFTVYSSTDTSINVQACDQYTSSSGNTYTTSGVYIDSLSTSNGCDSIVTIDLVILGGSTSSNNYTYCSGDSVYVVDEWISSNGTFFDTLTNQVGCDSIIQNNVDELSIDTSIITFSGFYQANDTSYDSYQWIDCNTGLPIVGATSSSYSGTGPVQLAFTEEGCTDTSNCHLLTLGVDDLSSDDISIFPNPFSDRLVVKSSSSLIEEIKICDSQGRIVFRKEYIPSREIILDFEGAVGLYHVHCQTNEGTIVEPIIHMK